MNYIPHTKEHISKMLSVVGCLTLDELVSEFKPRLSELNLDNPMSEMELVSYMTSLSEKNSLMKYFVGGGAYDHYIPSVINHLVSISARGQSRSFAGFIRISVLHMLAYRHGCLKCVSL
jgi:glycine dehydrogenase subunit 1